MKKLVRLLRLRGLIPGEIKMLRRRIKNSAFFVYERETRWDFPGVEFIDLSESLVAMGWIEIIDQVSVKNKTPAFVRVRSSEA
jgi:hypothetical protein